MDRLLGASKVYSPECLERGVLGNQAVGSTHFLERLSTPERIRAEQEVTRRYAAIMPFWMSSVIISCLPVLALSRGRSAFRPTLAGTACFVGMLASTLAGNMPINNRVLEMSPETDGEEFVALRERWDRLHSLRVALYVAGLGLLCAGAPSRGAVRRTTGGR